MKALSIKQPWAWLIVRGWKDVENRKWKTNYRGPLLIHSSKNWDIKELERANKLIKPTKLTDNIKHYKFGEIIGVVELYDCVEEYESKWFEGPYGFLLRNHTQFETSIPYKGMLGLFNVKNEDIYKYIKEQEL
jgi:hypothetical protein